MSARARRGRAASGGPAAGTWRKSPPELVVRFEGALPEHHSVERRTMFGYPCAFVGGNMFAGLFEEEAMVRLGDADRAELLARAGARPFEPRPGRRMKEYVVVPPALCARSASLRAWIARAFAYASALPVKHAAGRDSAPRAAAARTRGRTP